MSNKTKPFTQVTLEDLAGLRGLGASSILVYMALRIYGGKDSRAWPSQDRIASDLGMPIGSVRRAMAQLRKQKAIVKTSAKTKSPTYHIRDMSIADMRCQKKPEDLESEMSISQIRDPSIADMRSEDRRSDRQIDKVIDKENIHLINKTHSTPKQIDTTDSKKGESNDSLEMDELDLLFVELWTKHSAMHGMQAKSGNPLTQWRQIKLNVGIHQAKRGLKTLDLKMSASGRSWQSFAGGRWVLKLEAWIKREPNTLINRRDMQYLAGSIEVDKRDLESHRHEVREAKEASERAQAIALQPDTAARGLWRDFRLNNEEWPDLVNAVQAWKKTFLTNEVKKEIESDPQLEDFAMIISF